MTKGHAARQIRAQWKAQANMLGIKAPKGAEAAGVGVRQFHRWLSGGAQINDLETFADKLGMTFTVTFGNTAESPPQSLDWDGLMDTLDLIAVTVKAITPEEARDRKAKRMVGLDPGGLQTPHAPDGAAQSGGRNR